ncbi:MAG: MATE family efflux transporter [Oscillospiraceae bacterium]|nr:MATE family efflux transporter [Oscillospiraceae bacterium]
MRSRNRSMLEGPLFVNIILYTIPIILTSVLQLLFNAADLVVVGRFCGSMSVAAVGATTHLTHLLVNFFVGISVGAGVAVAHGIGRRDGEEVRRTVHTALPMALVCGAVLTLVGVTCSETFLRMMDTPASVLPLSTVYMKICFAGVTFTVVYNFCAAILRAAGDTRSPLVFLTLSGVINVLMNLFFVCILHMNVAGVALATTLSQGISAVLVVIALMRRQDECRLELKKMRFYAEQIRKIIRIGLPAGTQSALFSVSNVLVQSSVNSFGDVFVSGTAAAANVEGFMYAGVNAYHQSAVNFVGQNAGAGQYDRVKKTLRICLGSVMVTGIAMSTGICVFGRQLLSLYIPDSPEAVAWGLFRFYNVGSLYFLFGMMDVLTGAIRGMGSSLVPMVICLLGACGLRILWILAVFPLWRTPGGLYKCYPISWIVTLAALLVAYGIVYRKHAKNLVKGPEL